MYSSHPLSTVVNIFPLWVVRAISLKFEGVDRPSVAELLPMSLTPVIFQTDGTVDVVQQGVECRREFDQMEKGLGIGGMCGNY